MPRKTSTKTTPSSTDPTTSRKGLKAQAASMAEMNVKSGVWAGHPWWSVGQAVLAAYKVGDTKTIAAMEAAYRGMAKEE